MSRWTGIPTLNLPSEGQRRSIDLITRDRQARLADALQWDIRMIPYSAKARYNLQGLFTALVEACPEDRAWLFSSLKNFAYDDFLTAEARQVIETTRGPARRCPPTDPKARPHEPTDCDGAR